MRAEAALNTLFPNCPWVAGGSRSAVFVLLTRSSSNTPSVWPLRTFPSSKDGNKPALNLSVLSCSLTWFWGNAELGISKVTWWLDHALFLFINITSLPLPERGLARRGQGVGGIIEVTHLANITARPKIHPAHIDHARCRHNLGHYSSDAVVY